MVSDWLPFTHTTPRLAVHVQGIGTSLMTGSSQLLKAFFAGSYFTSSES